MEISQTSATYYHQLMQYNRLLQQRNAILKEYRGKQNIPLEEWDLQLADMASFIVKKRLESLKKINLLIDLMNRKLTGGLENLTIGYEQPYMDNGLSLIHISSDLLRSTMVFKPLTEVKISISSGVNGVDPSITQSTMSALLI